MASRPLPGPDELYDSAPCGLLLAGARGEILDVNSTLCRWLKCRKEDLVGVARFQDLLTMGGRIFYQTHLAPLVRMQGSVAEVKLELRCQPAPIPVMVNLAERAWQGERLMHVAVFVAEDRHKYERELLLQRRRAEDLATQHAQDQTDLAVARAQAEDRALFAEQMVGIVSHDLRNPLSAIHMSAVLMGMGTLSDTQRTALARVERSVGRAERLIADLLDFTQARLGKGISVRLVRVDLNEVVADCIGELSAAFPERRIVHAGSAVACQADADRIAQALGNLVANAAHYGSPDSPVTVTVARQEGRCMLSIHNHGDPIPPALRDALFEPMIRGTTKVAQARGVGLGLYIVREIAKAHGGSVQVESEAERGTTFTLSLPLAGP
ncbi:HAMP domain-containing histidine kinase [Caenimonas sedimenti]|uniref:histidine kinase n=1 Tax=Caenimonas sedimenti TaxID=2596921 RepID=A0A562ZWS1_9BURK|nr:HAMP domain-containing sensor histidine kinase [Caenimonas sedimenti]TWO72768.1 HAMP domain-containing histidine kinase [Caenimonas sedimenti]